MAQRQGVEPLFSLAQKTAVVTGAAGYLGRIFTEALLDAGARVVLMGRGEKLLRVSQELEAHYGEGSVEAKTVDFFDTESFRDTLQDLALRPSGIDILINNAFEFSKETGFNDPSGRFESLSKVQWMRAMESGVYWHALATQVVAEAMAERRRGTIVNVSSMYALVSPDPALYEGTTIFNPPTYGATKAALLSLTRYTAAFYGARGVRCNALLPGAFPNLGGDSYNAPRNEEFLRRLCDRTAAGTMRAAERSQGSHHFFGFGCRCVCDWSVSLGRWWMDRPVIGGE